ncbi:MAG TPA: HopJ type III effector protein [Cellvibrio sp.]|nr:HopJ type III effector protein [Cellvibrio sp.]
MPLNEFLNKLANTPEQIQFKETIAVIDSLYRFTPTAFRNGEFHNEAGQNSGSCKVFSFAKLHQLTPQQTLNCFGDYYRVDVLQHPEAQDHQNIRNFIRFGWTGIEFSAAALAQAN